MKIGFFEFSWREVLDLFLVAILLYNIYKLVRGTIASRVFMGYILVYLSYLFVRILGLELLTKILEYFMGVGAIALIVLFQQEIRRFLLLIGKSNSSFLNRILANKAKTQPVFLYKPVADAVKTMSNDFTGVLIVIQREDDLSKFIESGDVIDGILSKRLLLAIFNEHSPLHDGAVIISKDKIKAARCILPVSEGDKLPASYGFRHRAALGITEVTDSVVLIVSEETGKMSITYDGEISPVVAHELEDKLKGFLFDNK